MEKIEIVLPKLGESIVSATVVQWLKKIGDPIAMDEPLLEVSTDKVNSEIPSPVAGILKEIFAKEDEIIEVGMKLAIVETGEFSSPREFSASRQQANYSVRAECPNTETQREKEAFFSPAVLRMANLEAIPLETLRKIEGTGEGGRITKRDLEKFLEERTSPSLSVLEKSHTITDHSAVERIKMSGMRKAIAENMVRSFYEAPHASVVTEADVTEVMSIIAREKERFASTHGAKLTITSFLIQALTKSVQQFPMLNASLDGETIVLKKFVNVGIAVNIDKGLMVPVIKSCQERNIVSIAKAVADLSSRARAGKLSMEETKEGSITLTNFGMTGALIGVPIIRYPEVAIIGAGTIQKRIVVKEDESFAIRQMMYLSLTFDHRVIDGIYGCEFLASFKHHLESISLN
jgi:2-oxoglutarate dehydrogenase E2 component (dihydrolipoamide succinyltransferase)